MKNKRTLSVMVLFIIISTKTSSQDLDPSFFRSVKGQQTQDLQEVVQKLSVDRLQDYIENGVPHGIKPDSNGQPHKSSFPEGNSSQ